jgi:hypothetical protein
VPKGSLAHNRGFNARGVIVNPENTANMARFTPSFFATAAIACYVYGAVALVLLHVLRPDYPPASHMISDYGVGPYGWIMQTVFLAMSCGCLMLVLGLARSSPRSVSARLALVLLAIVSIGLVVSAIFPTDLVATHRTRAGEIHIFSFLVNVAGIFLAAILLSVGFGSDARWHTYQRTAVILTLLIAIAFIVQFLTLHRGMPYGLANRFFVAVLFAWFLATSFRLRRIGP